jgi:glycosyltransferase involved in cell wall biosynthesis
MVHYVGHLSHTELPNFIASGAVFVASPLWAEPFGLSVVEAMATGTPVAALPNGALPELVTATAGRVSRLVSARSLAAAIRSARTVERDGVRLNAARFSLNHMLDEYETELMDLAESIPQVARDAAS